MNIHLACDFGGGSGRVMAGWLEDGKVRLEEIHRFQNRQVRLGDTLYWDFPALFQDMKDGLRKAAARFGDRVVSIGIDTWGVDFGLIDRQGHLLGLPVCYRDARTKGLPERYFASTSELLNARTRDWDWELIDDAGLPRSLFGPIVMPGTVRGPILPHIAEETGLAPTVKVVAVASHDTASAVMSIPGFDEPAAWISSGTWSLLGVTVSEPILTPEACDAGFTNEGGADGKITFLSNITGLWILQQLAKEWRTDDWAAMTAEARDVQSVPLIDVDDSAFTAPESMQKAIFTAVGRELTRGETVRCVLESLAKRYATAIRKLNTMLEEPVRRLHIIGGGSQNVLLNELTAQATGLKVTTGDVEATAVGNVMGQIGR